VLSVLQFLMWTTTTTINS